MNLALPLDFGVMEAGSAQEIPAGPDWQYEPKWDGFRCLAFRDGDDVELMSKSGQALARYFPEIVSALLALGARKFVVDGELLIALAGNPNFDALLQRIHPAASRITKLSEETPATLILFDMLVEASGDDVSHRPLRERRLILERFHHSFAARNGTIRLSPATTDFQEAKNWFNRMAGPLDGVMAKRRSKPYESGKRMSMLKIKNLRSADCVVGGFRCADKQKQVASLLLGLYDEAGLLHHVGYTSGLVHKEKAQLTEQLEALVEEPGFTGAKPGGLSRWSGEHGSEWKPLAPRLVIEVQYDHFTGGRFRHGTRILRWRPDKRPDQCTLEQVKRDTDSPLTLLD